MTTQLPILFGAVIAATFVGVGLIMLARRHFLGKDAHGDILPFTLQDLREMHARGEITSVEFESMRAAIIGTYRAPPPADGQRKTPEFGDPPNPPPTVGPTPD
ncbi:MAG: SHOCT domain-containing protein [Phycisphaerales bacterium]|nr:SHOCT domain-containing protein [Phycisphaerales bacterium]